MESQIFSVLVLSTFGMLLVVTGGVAYLTIAEWRDRRRRERDGRDEGTNRRTPAKR